MTGVGTFHISFYLRLLCGPARPSPSSRACAHARAVSVVPFALRRTLWAIFQKPDGAGCGAPGPTCRWYARALLALLIPAIALSGCLAFHPERISEPKADASAPSTRFVTINGIDLRVREEAPKSSTAPTVLLLHGFGSSLDTWSKLVPRLAATHRVIAVDLKGFGHSARPEGDYSPAAQAALLVALLDHLNVDRTAVVAHSWGSSVALALALAAPARVTRLALYAAWVYDEQIPPYFRWAKADGLGETLFALYFKERPDERLARAFYDPSVLEERYVERVTADLDRPGTLAAALAAVRGMDYLTLAPRYRDVAHPTLLVWGQNDRISPPHFGERLAADLPQATLVTYPRCGHFPHVEAFDASTRRLIAFLAEAP